VVSQCPLARDPATHREDAEYECNQRAQAQDKHVTPKLVRGVVEERHLQGMHTIVERIKSRDVLEHNGLKGEDTNPSRQKKQ